MKKFFAMKRKHNSVSDIREYFKSNALLKTKTICTIVQLNILFVLNNK